MDHHARLAAERLRDHVPDSLGGDRGIALQVPAQADDLVVDFNEVALVSQAILLELKLDGSHIVQLLGNRCFAAEHFKLHIGI